MYLGHDDAHPNLMIKRCLKSQIFCKTKWLYNITIFKYKAHEPVYLFSYFSFNNKCVIHLNTTEYVMGLKSFLKKNPAI